MYSPGKGKAIGRREVERDRTETIEEKKVSIRRDRSLHPLSTLPHTQFFLALFTSESKRKFLSA